MGVMRQRLPGGRTTGATRVGDTVRKPTRPWTPSVRAVLDHLEAVGFEGAPRALGVDDQGHQVLTYLPGDTVGERRPWPDWVWSDTALVQVGTWLRQLHDATADFVPPESAVWFAGQSWRPGVIIGHHDAAPYNVVWCGERLVGFVDWDIAGPSSRAHDLAFVALSWVPLQARRVAAEQGFGALSDRARRLHLLLDAYRYDGDRAAFGTAVSNRARVNAAVIRRLAEAGDPIYVAMRPLAADMEEAASEVEAFPPIFWKR
jgi:hypothetical protein